MLCMARLVRVIFGKSTVAERKLYFGPTLVALGIRITPCASGYSCELEEEKAAKCIATIIEALNTGELNPRSGSQACRPSQLGLAICFSPAGEGYVEADFWQRSQL